MTKGKVLYWPDLEGADVIAWRVDGDNAVGVIRIGVRVIGRLHQEFFGVNVPVTRFFEFRRSESVYLRLGRFSVDLEW